MNRKQRRAFEKINRPLINEHNSMVENKKTEYVISVNYWNFKKWFFMISPHKSIFGFHLNLDLGKAKEYIAIHFFFKSYSIGKIK